MLYIYKMSNQNSNNYVTFCLEYQRQMNHVINTYAAMHQRLYELMLNNNENDTNTPNETNNTNEINNTNETNNANNINSPNNSNNPINNTRNTPILNNTLPLNNQTQTVPNQPNTSITASVMSNVPLSSIHSTLIPSNISTHTLYTNLNNLTNQDIQNLLQTNMNDIFGTVINNLFNTPIPNLDDVVIRATNEQIERATQTMTFGDIENPSHDSCPIGLTQFNDDDEVIQIRHCRHIFNPNNIRSWFSQSVRCPLCRYDIREYTDPNNDNTDNNETSEIDEALDDILNNST